MFRIDHLVVTTPRLEDGAALVAHALGAVMLPGGKHATMGTHNCLLSLGDCYLEVIAVDPDAAPPGRARWFDLDGGPYAPRLTHWVMRGSDLFSLTAAMPELGPPADFARGDLRWQMLVPPDGQQPFGGAFPAAICWQGDHATDRLPDSGLHLRHLTIAHPNAAVLRHTLAPWLDDARLIVIDGPAMRLEAVIDTPNGERSLT